MPFTLPKINLPQINQSGINTALVMEAVAPGTGLISGAIANQNPGFFDGVKNWFSGIGSGGSGAPAPGSDNRTGTTNYSGLSNKQTYIILGVLVVVVIAVVVITRKKK